MNLSIRTVVTFGCLLIVGVCQGAERIEIVLDASAEMWKPFQTGVPRIVAARNAITALIVSPDVVNRDMEFGLRTIGGRAETVWESSCGDTASLIPSAPIVPGEWLSVLSGIEPKGGRALVRAVEESVESLAANEEEESRIVVLTSGDDECLRDVSSTLELLIEENDHIRIRVIGLDLERKFSNSMLLSTPTRNVSDPGLLYETLQWAVLHPATASTRPELLELKISSNGTPLTNASVQIEDPSSDEGIEAEIENGNVQIRIKPGVHRAILSGPDLESIELAGIVHDGLSGPVEIALAAIPPVTLEVAPEGPPAGGEASIHYWGAPVGDNWLALAVAGAPVGDYIVRSPAPGPEGEVVLELPDSPSNLDMLFTRDVGAGVQQLLGRTSLVMDRRTISIEAPDSVENRTPFQVSWSASTFDGDHIILTGSEGDAAGFAVCIPAADEGAVTTTAPALPGDYAIRYLSRKGRVLDQAKIQVFEVLATLDAPGEVAAGGEITISWTGPEEQQDYLSLAVAGAADDQYLSWAPAIDGNPTRLAVPINAGPYEIRYVRGEDGEVLARQPLEVVAVEITIEVPSVVTAGTRFEVIWTGTAGDGDFIAVARPRTNARNFLDWASTGFGSPVTLAAPFESGSYVVRYISGASKEIITRQRINVR